MPHARRVIAAAVAAVAIAAAPALSAEDSPIAAGKAVFEKKCATCHTIERSIAKKTDVAGWEKIIAAMIEKGATLDQTERDQILGYLGAKSAFETRCNTCHDLDKPLATIKNPEAWKTTVARMAGMKPGVISDAEAGAITLYLSLVPAPAK